MDSIASYQLQDQNLSIILNCLYLQLFFSPSSFLSVYTHVHFIPIFKSKLSSDQNLSTSDEPIFSPSAILKKIKVICSHISSQFYTHTLIHCNLTFAPTIHLKWFCPKWPLPAYFLSPLIWGWGEVLTWNLILLNTLSFLKLSFTLAFMTWFFCGSPLPFLMDFLYRPFVYEAPPFDYHLHSSHGLNTGVSLRYLKLFPLIFFQLTAISWEAFKDSTLRECSQGQQLLSFLPLSSQALVLKPNASTRFGTSLKMCPRIHSEYGRYCVVPSRSLFIPSASGNAAKGQSSAVSPLQKL